MRRRLRLSVSARLAVFRSRAVRHDVVKSAFDDELRMAGDDRQAYAWQTVNGVIAEALPETLDPVIEARTYGVARISTASALRSSTRIMRTSNWRTTVLAGTAFLLGTIAAGSGNLRAAWEPIARFIRLEDPPKPASANVLSEHEIAVLDEMTPQGQAELLLERSINHYSGANDQIAARVRSWRGQIVLNGRLNNLFITAINSSDLTVRVAGIEVDIAARNLTVDSSTVDRLEPVARSGEQGPRANALWDLALIGNRGVDQNRILEILLDSTHDENVNIRYWAVEGLAYLAIDASIEPLLDIFHDDPSPMIRERAACGLAQSGMFSAEQRRTAVPRLLDFAIDGALEPDTRTWVFQALRDITGQTLPHDARRWREWYEASRK